jgi:hypothetical protein
MTTKLLAASAAVALTTALAMGTASAASAFPGHDQTVAPVAAPAHAHAATKVDWHYAWRYRYTKYGYLPGWVAVLNNSR